MSNNVPTMSVGIVGLGEMGRHHATLVDELGHYLVAGADVAAEAREKFEADFEGVETFESHQEMYDATSIDAVVITTPNKFHEPAATDALERGVSVLIEKPLAHTIESAERIAEVHAASDGVGMVGFHNRFRSPAMAAKAYVEEGDLGDVSHVESAYVRRRGVPGRGTWFTSKEFAGGGAVVDIGVHIIDLTLYLMDFPEIEQVTGVTRQEFGHREDYEYLHMWGEDTGDVENFDVEDSASALIQTADDQTISLEVAWASNGPGRESIRLWGTEAGATLDLQEKDLTLHETRQAGIEQHVDSEVSVLDRDLKKAEDEMFFDAVATGEKPELNTIEEALSVQRVLDGIYRSSRNGGETIEVGN